MQLEEAIQTQRLLDFHKTKKHSLKVDIYLLNKSGIKANKKLPFDFSFKRQLSGGEGGI